MGFPKSLISKVKSNLSRVGDQFESNVRGATRLPGHAIQFTTSLTGSAIGGATTIVGQATQGLQQVPIIGGLFKGGKLIGFAIIGLIGFVIFLIVRSAL